MRVLCALCALSCKEEEEEEEESLPVVGSSEGRTRPRVCAAAVIAGEGSYWPRNHITAAASAASAAWVRVSSGANCASATWPSTMFQVATARPSASANGRNRPLTVTIRRCGPTIGSREAQPSSSGSNAPSSSGGGSAAAARRGLAGSSARPSARWIAPHRARPSRASRSPMPDHWARSRSDAEACPARYRRASSPSAASQPSPAAARLASPGPARVPGPVRPAGHARSGPGCWPAPGCAPSPDLRSAPRQRRPARAAQSGSAGRRRPARPARWPPPAPRLPAARPLVPAGGSSRCAAAGWSADAATSSPRCRPGAGCRGSAR
jgi:hypothetical protein